MDAIKIVSNYERFVYGALVGLLMIVIAFSLIDLVWVLLASLSNDPVFLLRDFELTKVLGTFLLILIGVELLDTMVSYLRENTIHVEIVVLLAIIAISRKVILLEPSTTNGIELIGIGIVIVGLAAAFFLLKKAGYTIGPGKEQKPE